MISLTIKDTKTFMNHLLKEATFDAFSFRTGALDHFCQFDITAPRGTEKVSWETMKPYVLHLIKGKTAPRSIKVILTVGEAERLTLDPDGEFFLNIYFENGQINLTTGTSTKIFTLDKTMDGLWEDYVRGFLDKHGLGYSENYEED